MGRMAERAAITVRGTVQGVGFRPFVYGLARALALSGRVTNTSEGVSIDVEGERVHEFIRRLTEEAPPLSRIAEVSVTALPPCGHDGFAIAESSRDGRFTLVPPDVSTCPDCLRELHDPADRRYLYPFINCTNCGPRYSITRSIPYDRDNTTMAPFGMCPECEGEYRDPGDRRFHAEPNACPVCGPKVELVFKGGERISGGCRPLDRAAGLLREGGIVAVKGLGGFHIACDATNDGAVKRLRERKRKSNKPFALMAPDMETIEKCCVVTEDERGLLESNRRPIVLLRKREDAALSGAVSPVTREFGFMLPYTPLHHILLAKTARPLVMTSGNISEEPIVKDNEEAVKRLSHIADAFLLHDRDIFMRVDDSVVRWRSGVPGHPACIRRSRGYCPEPVALDGEGPEVLGAGADLKNTFCLTKGRFAIPGQHIGDMENYETLRFFEESLENLKSAYRVEPVAVAHDLHPDYLSTRWALGQDMQGIPIQHHYAHVASVMAEHGLRKKVMGVAFDGTGYGTDGRLWGGEFLVADIEGFERAGHLKYIPLPGGQAAIREPWRTAVSCIVDAVGDRAREYLESLGFTERHGAEAVERVFDVLRAGEAVALSSGAGRLFDAVSAMLGICDRNTFEGEAAVALEGLTQGGVDGRYPFGMPEEGEGFVVDFAPAFVEVVRDVSLGLDRGVIASRFHNTVSEAVVQAVSRMHERRGLRDVVLSGGTFQNAYLLAQVSTSLASRGLKVHVNEKVPCNDGGISLGQAYLARERLKG